MNVLIGLFLYNAINCYTDVRWRITKNVWHLLFLLMWLIALWLQGLPWTEWISVLWWGCAFWLFVGLLFESKKVFSPGDTKMLIVNALGISSWVEGAFPGQLLTALYFYGASVSCLLLVSSMILVIRKYGLVDPILVMITRSKELDMMTFPHLPGALHVTGAVLLSVTILQAFPS